MRFLAKLIKLWQLLPVGVYRRALRKGVAAAVEHSAMVSSLPISTLVDIGANVGQFSLLVKKEHPKAAIHAFEPLDQSAQRYRSVMANFKKIKLYQVAIGEFESSGLLNISNKADSSSLHPITELQSTVFPGTHSVGTEEVSIVKLSSVVEVASLSKPVLAKIDVQGYELDVLRGMSDCFTHIEWVYVECSFMELYSGQALANDVVSFMLGNQYSLEGVYNLSTTSAGLAVQGDFLFRRCAR